MTELTSEHLVTIRAHIDEGRRMTALREVDSLLRTTDFDRAEANVQAGLLRTRAFLALNIDHDVALSAQLAARAAELEESEDQHILEASIRLHKDGPDSALSLLQAGGIKTTLFRATLLYFQGNIASAASLIDAVADGYPDNVELHRLLAMLRLAAHQWQLAEAEAKRAYQLRPKHLFVNVTLATVNFMASVPQDFIPVSLDDAPEPAPREYIIADEDALNHLRRSGDMFTECLAVLEQGDPMIAELELWRLACLSQDPNRSEEAAAYSKVLLERDPPNHRAAIWTAGFGLAVDLTTWLKNANESVERGTASSQQRYTVGWLALDKRQFENATDVLSAADVSESGADRTRRTLLLAQVYAMQRKYNEAIQVLEDTDYASFARLREILKAQQQGIDVDTDGRYKNTTQISIDRVKRAAEDGKWQIVAGMSAEIMRSFHTPLGYQLVLQALYNTEQYDRFLKIFADVGTWTRLNRDGQFRNAHISSLRAVGKRAEALRAMEALFHDDQSAATCDLYGRMLFESGDYNGIATLSRALRKAGDLTSDISLRFAAWLQNTHPDDAAALWDKAVALGVKDDLIGLALSIAYRVGRETCTKTLVHRMQEIATNEASGIKRASFEEVREVVAQSSRSDQYMGEQYRFGRAAIHIVGDAIRWPLFMSHYMQPQLNASVPPAQWTNIYVRHGSRGPLLKGPITARVCNLDLTALMMLQSLDAFDIIRDAFDVIAIPVQTTIVLHDAFDQISVGQPSRMDSLERIKHSVEGGGIQIVAASNPFRWARDNGGLFATPLPTIDTATAMPVPVTKEARSFGLNLVSLINQLLEVGVISKWQADEALALSGTAGSEAPIGASLSGRKKLLCSIVLLEYLDEAQLLGPILNSGYNLFLLEQDRAFLQKQIEDAERRTQLADTLKHLIPVVRDNIGTNKFEQRSSKIEIADPSNFNAQSLATLLDTAAENEILAVDDRVVTSYERTGKGALVVSTLDLLNALRGPELPDGRYYQILHSARKGGLFFIPLDASEILYFLRRASVRDGLVQETAELRVLRRYLGACLNPNTRLRVIDPIDERMFLQVLNAELSRACNQAADEGPNADAYVDYIVASLCAADISAFHQRLVADDPAFFSSLETLVTRLNA
ncbi:MAG TPA: hypothetical protein VGG22_07900 [Candidatus Baltobacteraceae bacterium]|jgi:Flp pilus assembly protein TadD